MKVLIAIPYFPYPLNGGGHQATFHMINYLRDHLDITLVCPSASRSNVEALRKKWPNVSVQVSSYDPVPESISSISLYKARFLYNKFKKDLKSGIKKVTQKGKDAPLDICDQKRRSQMRIYQQNFLLEDAAFINLFQDLVNNNSFDIVQLEFADMAGLAQILPENTRSVFVHHELTFKVIEREVQTLGDAGGLETILQKQAWTTEMHLLNQFRSILVFSKQDKNFLIDAGIDKSKLFVSPFTVPARSGSMPVLNGYRYKNKLVFLGSESHNPNLDAVYWFVKDVFPHIREKFPETFLYIIGSWRKEVKDMFKSIPNLVFTGFVDDLDEALEGAVMVVPIRIGSGIRTKIIDAVMRKVPVLTTTIGIEGIPLEDGKECLVADNPEDFVKKIQLLQETNFAASLIQNAFIKISQWNNPERCVKQRLDIYNNIFSPEHLHLNKI